MKSPSIFTYLPDQAGVLWKLATEQPKKEEAPIEHPVRHALKTVGGGLASMAAGTLMGYGGGALANKAYTAATGKEIPGKYLMVPASLAGAGLNYAYQRYKDEELKELRRAYESYRNRTKGSVSGQ